MTSFATTRLGRSLAAALVVAASWVATPALAAAAPTTPVTATIQDGVGAAGVVLGMTRSQVDAQWGSPTRCSVTGSGQICSYRSADGVERAQVRLNSGVAGTVSLVTVPFSNPTWSTGKGIHVGSSAAPSAGGSAGAAFDTAYGPLVDPKRSSYYSRYVPAGTGATGGTRFTLGWIDEYSPGQYFGVTAITVVPG